MPNITQQDKWLVEGIHRDIADLMSGHSGEAASECMNRAYLKAAQHREEAERKGREEALQWQPIETAPRDGTLIWLYDENTRVKEIAAFIKAYNSHCGGPFGEPNWYTSNDYWYGGYRGNPTHWMPLPPAPTEDK